MGKKTTRKNDGKHSNKIKKEHTQKKTTNKKKVGGKKEVKNISKLFDRFFPDKQLLLLLIIATTIIFSYKFTTSFGDGIDYVHIGTRSSIKQIFNDIVADQPPLFFLIIKGWDKLFGVSELSIRLFLFSFYIGLIGINYYTIRKIFKTKFSAFLSSFLIMVNPTIIWFCFEPKYWMAIVSVSCLSLLTIKNFIDNPNKKNQFFFGITTGMLPAISLVGFGIILAYGIFICFIFLKKEITIKKLVFPLIIILVLSFPAYQRHEETNQYLTTSQQAGKYGIMEDTLNGFFSNVLNSLFFVRESSTKKTIGLLMILTTAIIGLFSKRKYRYSWLLALIIFVMCVGGVKMSDMTSIRARYFTLIIPPIFILSSFGLETLSEFKVGKILLVIFIILFSGFFVDFFRSFYLTEWKIGSDIIKENVRGDEEVVVVSTWNWGFSDMYLGYKARGFGSMDTVRLPKNKNYLIVDMDHFNPTNIEEIAKDFNITDVWITNKLYVVRATKKNQDNYKKMFDSGDFEVSIRIGDYEINCSEIENRDMCYKETWQYVEVKNEQFSGKYRKCFFAHPRNNQILKLKFPSVRLSNSLNFYSGISDWAVNEKLSLSPVDIKIYHNEAEIDWIVSQNEIGFFEKQIDTKNFKNLTGIEFWISAEDDYKRHFCFDFDVSENIIQESDSLYNQIQEAEVYIQGDNLTRCDIWMDELIFPHNEKTAPFRDGRIYKRWDCGENLSEDNKIWMTFGQAFDKSDGEYKHALWAHPHSEKTLVIKYGNITVNGSINGFIGFSDLGFENMASNKLNFKIEVDDEVVYDIDFEKQKGWKNFSIYDLPTSGIHNVTVKIFQDNNVWTRFYFNAFT